MYKGMAIGFMAGLFFTATMWASTKPDGHTDCTAQNNAIMSCDKHLSTCLSWQARVIMELERIEGVAQQ